MSRDADPAGAIDVDLLMEDLKARVRARRAAGELDPAVLALPFSADAGAVDDGDDDAHVRLRLETAYSSKAYVGRPITVAKRGAIRFVYHFLNDMVDQVNAALGRLSAALRGERDERERLEIRAEELASEVARLRAEVDGLRDRLERDGGTPPSE